MSESKQQVLSSKEGKAAAKALEVLFTTEYVSKRELYKSNFIRGIFFSAGSIVGAAIVVTLLLWLLSLFENVPLLGPVFENVQNTVESSK